MDEKILVTHLHDLYTLSKTSTTVNELDLQTQLMHRVNRALELIESHRASEAMLLLRGGETMGDVEVLPVEKVNEADVAVDELAQVLHLAGERFICLFQVLVRHALLRRRQVRAIVPMQDGVDEDGYELDALLFHFVPGEDALAPTSMRRCWRCRVGGAHGHRCDWQAGRGGR